MGDSPWLAACSDVLSVRPEQIEIADRFSLVEVPEDFADDVISALDDNRMRLVLQPMVRATDNKPALYECLLRMERPGGDLKDIRGKAVAVMDQAYAAYGQAFSHFLGRFNKWDQGFSSNYFARLTASSVHKDVLPKLASYKIQNVLNDEFLGFSTSSALCDNLDIPLLPYQENDALAKRYAVKFNDDLAAQQQIDIPDADLRFEIVLRDVDKQKTDSTQRGVTIVKRSVVIRLIVIDEYSNLPDKKLLNVLAMSTSEDRIPLQSTEDDTPERDLVFFDRLISRTLSNLLRGMATRNASTLAAAEVKLSFVEPALPRLMELCAKTRG